MNYKTLMPRGFVTGVICSIAVAGSVHGQTPDSDVSLEPQTDSKDWKFGFAPYLWMVNVNGTIGLPRTGASPVDVPFSTLKDNINFGFAGVLSAEYKRFGIVLEGNFVNLQGAGALPTPGPLENRIDFDQDLFFGNSLLTYRLDLDQPFELQVGVGARTWHVGMESQFSLNGTPTRNQSLKATWVDGVVATRLAYPFAKKWYADVAGSVGAGASDLTGSANAGVGFKATDWFHLYLSYRFMMVDYSDSGFVYDVRQHGALLGLAFVF